MSLNSVYRYGYIIYYTIFILQVFYFILYIHTHSQDTLLFLRCVQK